MSKLYIVIKAEYTNLYDEEGNLIEININGTMTNKIYNTVSFNYEADNLSLVPDKLPLENAYYYAFEPVSEIGGCKYESKFKIYVLFKNILSKYLEDKYDEFYVILADDFVRQSVEKNGISILEDFVDVLGMTNRKGLDITQTCYGPFLESAIMNSLFEQQASEYPNGIIYVNDSFAYGTFTEKNTIHHFFRGWKEEVNLKEIEDKFKNYLQEKGLIIHEDNINNLFITLSNLARKNEGKEQISYIYKDEKYLLDCKVINDYFNELKEREKDHLKEILNHGIVSNKFQYILDISEEEFYLEAEKVFKEKGIKPLNNNNRQHFNKLLLKYCDLIVKYNKPLYRVRIKNAQKHSKNDLDMLFDKRLTYYYKFHLYLRKNEHQQLLKELGYKYNPNLYKYHF